MDNSDNKTGLGELIARGGVYYKVPGNSGKEVLTAFIGALPARPLVSREDLLKAVLEREALMSTSIGRGIAIPHPRNPVISDSTGQFTALGFLENPVDWKALDGKPVDTLLLIISSSAKMHLQTLSKINFFCQQGAFLELLRARAPGKDIIAFINDMERDWK
ncbi:MAG: PTS sugar transporter subunit IIA [Treponema sp.]|jgi:PTS system nitrogen regulatory IIA component|nr:PTS sugar transporter subunit IIA [Treponema sp.]